MFSRTLRIAGWIIGICALLFGIFALLKLLTAPQTVVADQSYPISPAPNSAFYRTARQGDIVLYAGYDHDRTLDVFAFNPEQNAFVAREQYRLDQHGFVPWERYRRNNALVICEAPTGVVLSGPENSQTVDFQAGALSMQRSQVPCPDPSSGIACREGVTLVHGWLPGRWIRSPSATVLKPARRLFTSLPLKGYVAIWERLEHHRADPGGSLSRAAYNPTRSWRITLKSFPKVLFS